jgi:hypothetical protein
LLRIRGNFGSCWILVFGRLLLNHRGGYLSPGEDPEKELLEMEAFRSLSDVRISWVAYGARPWLGGEEVVRKNRDFASFDL